MSDQQNGRDRVKHSSDQYTDEVTTRRRNGVLKRVPNTAPEPRPKKPKERRASKGRVHKGLTGR